MLTTKHLPQSYTGQRFCRFFKHRFNFIKSSYSSTPEWITISDYPIEHRNLWSVYQDPERLIGLSFGTTTHYAVLDIDCSSPYHPGNSESQYRELLGAYEEVGINSVVTLQSSNSGGLHVYFVFPKALPTFKLAHMLRLTAIKAGYEVKDGKLEIFPNTKTYSKHSKTSYKAVRLPLQRGSWLLDKDFVPYSNDIEVFLEQGEGAAEEQDIELIETAIESASHIKQFRRVKGEGDACSFAQDLREQIGEGWTSFGQTNDLLRIIGTYGRVFKGLEGQALADYIVRTAETSPGYQQYCQHKHNIQRRSKDWGRCIEKYYYPYGSEPTRSGTFKDMQRTGNRQARQVKENVVNRTRQEEAVARIKQGMDYVRQTMAVLPVKVGAMKDLLLEAIYHLFGKRTSDSTLSRYREYWHPDYVSVTSPPVGESSSTIIDNDDNDSASIDAIESEIDLDVENIESSSRNSCHTPYESLSSTQDKKDISKPLSEETFSLSATPPSYMKVYVLNSFASGLVSRMVFGKESSSKLYSIQPASLVTLCSGAIHSLHPYLVYVKPLEGAEDWISGIAVLFSSLTLVNDS